MLAVFALLTVLAARVGATPSPAPSNAGVSLDPELDDAAELDDGELDPLPALVADPPLPDAAVVGSPPLAGPPLAAVIAAAYAAAGLDRDPCPGWRRRARLAGLVPTISVRDGRDATWQDVDDPTIGYVSVFMVSATWHLERLAFDPSELRISAIGAARRRERRHVASLAVHGFHAWLRARAAAASDPRWRTRVVEAAAELDALTDGWFSAATAKVPEPR